MLWTENGNGNDDDEGGIKSDGDGGDGCLINYQV